MSIDEGSQDGFGKRSIPVAALLLRLSLAAVLLSAVADRLGIWGPPGAPSVAWGNFANFLIYTRKINPWCPVRMIPALGWSVTLLEIVLGVALIAGCRLHFVALFVAILTGVFSLAMTITLGVHEPLNYSVFVVAAGAYLLSQVAESSPLRRGISK